MSINKGGDFTAPTFKLDIKMIDYIDITKHLDYKDNINWGHLKEEVRYIETNAIRYSLNGCKMLEIWYYPISANLRLKGSIMYYYQGHNFIFEKRGFVEAIKHIGNLLHCNLWDADVEAFEFGAILEVSKKPKFYIQNHREKPKAKLLLNEIPKHKGTFRWWNDSLVKLKMYDAGKNIKIKQGLSMQQILQNEGWNPQGNYLKWEVHYKKPHLLFNNGKVIQLADLVNPRWEEIFKADLLAQYNRLTATKTLMPSSDRKDYSTTDVAIQELAELKINNGYTIKEIKKELYSRINSIPQDILSDSDKKARKREIKKAIDKLNESDVSEWDLHDILYQKIYAIDST